MRRKSEDEIGLSGLKEGDLADDKELLMKMMRRMMLIRRFDETVKEMVQRGELVGAVMEHPAKQQNGVP